MFSFKSISSLILVCLITVSFTGNAYSQTKIRIGTYDSRAIAIAYYNSKYFKLMPEVTEKMKTAKERKDTTEISNINKEMSLRQRMMHEQGFGKGSVCFLIDEIKDKISELAKNEKLDIVVSKYELNYNCSGADIIDVTELIANLFEPERNIKDMIPDLQNNEPIKDAFLLED